MARTPQVVSNLLLARAPWDALDTEFEKRIPFDSPSDFRDCLFRQVASGESKLYHIIHEGNRVGIAIVKVEEFAARELILQAVYCDAPVPLSREIAEAAEEIAREEKCISIRFHTVRPAAARIAAEEYGYRLTEVIMRKHIAA